MDESLPQDQPDRPEGGGFAQLLEEQREKVQDFVASHRDRLVQIEAELSRQVERVAAELAHDHQMLAAGREGVAEKSQDLQDQAQRLEELKTELNRRQSEIKQLRERAEHYEQEQGLKSAEITEELVARQAELERREQQLEAEHRKAREQRADIESELEQLKRARERIDEANRQLDAERQRVEKQHGDTKAQRRRIAREISHQRASHSEELERTRAALTQEQKRAKASRLALEQEHAALTARESELKRKRGEFESTLAALEEAKSQISRLEAALAKVEQECNSLRESGAAAADAETAARVNDLEQERNALLERIVHLEAAPSTGEGNAASEEIEDLKQRCKMAVADLREEKARSAELEKRLAAAQLSSGGASEVVGASLDWEAQKRRMLAALEEFDEDEEDDAEAKLSIEETVTITDAIVAEKDRELRELRNLLDEQSGNIGDVAVGAAAIANMLGGDEIIAQEREKLQQMQDEWREKLRTTEIDMSVERAKVARERTKLEERMREFEEKLAQYGDVADSSTPAQPTPPKRGRWLARLGLKDDEEKS